MVEKSCILKKINNSFDIKHMYEYVRMFNTGVLARTKSPLVHIFILVIPKRIPRRREINYTFVFSPRDVLKLNIFRPNFLMYLVGRLLQFFFSARIKIRLK